MDEGFWAKEEREELKRKIESLGAKLVLYYVNTPIEEIRERLLGRNVNPGKESFVITEELFESYLKHWQPLTEDENYILAKE